MPTSVRSPALSGIAGESRRHEIGHAIDAQEREFGALVLGLAVGVAVAAHHDDVAAVGHLAVGEDVAGRADDDAGAVLDLAPGRRTDLHDAGIAVTPGNGMNALDITTTTGSMIGLGRLVVEHGHAAHLAVLDARRARRISSGPASPTG